MDKNKAVKSNNFFTDLDTAVKGLIEERENGKNVYFDFNGHRLYSADVTMDSAYLEVVGETKEEYERHLEEQRKKIEEQKRIEEQQRIEELKDKNKAVKCNNFFTDLDAAVKGLIKARENGENVYFDFNGHRLYSADVTMDSAYLEVVGKTKEEFERLLEERRKIIEEQQKIEKLKAEQRNKQNSQERGE